MTSHQIRWPPRLEVLLSQFDQGCFLDSCAMASNALARYSLSGTLDEDTAIFPTSPRHLPERCTGGVGLPEEPERCHEGGDVCEHIAGQRDGQRRRAEGGSGVGQSVCWKNTGPLCIVRGNQESSSGHRTVWECVGECHERRECHEWTLTIEQVYGTLIHKHSGSW